MNAISPRDESLKQYEQIAHLVLVGAAQVHIAEVIGVDESRISQILQEPEYKKVEAKVSVSHFETTKKFNDAWDGLEDAALTNLKLALRINKDPDFNLRAAMVANKAIRRGGGQGNSPIQAQSGMRANISLPQMFVKMLLQQNNTVVVVEDKDGGVQGQQNRINSMLPSQVEKHLGSVGMGALAGIHLPPPD